MNEREEDTEFEEIKIENEMKEFRREVMRVVVGSRNGVQRQIYL